MSKPLALLVVAIVVLSVLVSAGPTLVALAHATVLLILAIGGVAALLRLIWLFTSRY